MSISEHFTASSLGLYTIHDTRMWTIGWSLNVCCGSHMRIFSRVLESGRQSAAFLGAFWVAVKCRCAQAGGTAGSLIYGLDGSVGGRGGTRVCSMGRGDRNRP